MAAPRSAPRSIKSASIKAVDADLVNARPPGSAAKPPTPDDWINPRADGSLADGQTGGNYVQADVSVGPGSSKVQQGIDPTDPSA